MPSDQDFTIERMFPQPAKPRLAEEHVKARQLRYLGASVKEIAAHVGVAPSTVSVWCRDIELSERHRKRNRLRGAGARAPAWSERHRERRREYQEQGRQRARQGDALHAIGCMLYWAEGAKERNTATFANSDAAMIETFARFLRECFGVEGDDLRFKVNVYLGNGLELDEIEAFWAERLGCSRECARKPTINHFPTSSSGRRLNKLPYGVCTVSVNRSTWLVQHIYGAIQEYSGVDQPQWLDGPPRKPAAA
jgi:AcrR family transcriptional regulator